MITKFYHFNENKSKSYFYRIVEHEYLICDLDMCSKSDRTFDIKFNDLAKNNELLKVLDLLIFTKIKDFAEYLSEFNWNERKERYKKLMTNPTLRILAQDKDLFIQVLSIFNPNDIRVSAYKYNL